MEKEEFDPNCDGCKRSQGLDNVPGGIATLTGGWILNQYQGDESFLGWMALQPRQHRCELAQLKPDELRTLGENLQKIDLGLQAYWKKCFPNDLIKRVYVGYFYESVYDEPDPTSFHLHIHLIPRTQQLDRLLRECRRSDSNPSIITSTIIAWNIYKVTRHCDFPAEYRYDKTNDEDKRKAIDLMKFLRRQL